MEDDEAMVAVPVTGAEGDEQSGREELPDLRLWPEFGIPAQRAQLPPQADRDAASAADRGPTGATAAGDPARNRPANSSARPGTGQPNWALQRQTRRELSAPRPVPELSAPPSSAAMSATDAVPRSEAGPAPSAEAADSAAPTPTPYPVPSTEAEPASDGSSSSARGHGTSRRRGTVRRRGSSMRRQTAGAIAFLGWLAVAFLVLHRYLPDAGGIGSLLETWLPWLAVPVLVLLFAAAIVRKRRALIATLAATLVWTALYGPTLLPRGSDAPAQLRIFSEDVNGVAAEAAASGSMALAQHADIVALEDVYADLPQSPAVNALNSAYRYHVTEYQFGIWSRYPIPTVSPISLGTLQADSALSLGSQSADMAASATGGTPVIGALKATITPPDGKPLTVYLLHLPQPVLGNQGFAKARDAALTQLVAVLNADTSARLAVIGDVNVAATDRQFSQLTRGVGLQSAQQAAGSGFGFTWPAEFPIVRLDDVLTRGLKPLRSSVLPAIAGGQSHLPIEVDLDY